MTTQDAVSGPQRKPDELQRRLDACDGRDYGHFEREIAREAIAALRRLQAAQREPVAWWCTKSNGQDFITTDHGVAECHRRELDWTVTPLYTQAQRDDHPTEGLLREAKMALGEASITLRALGCTTAHDNCERTIAKLDAAKGTPAGFVLVPVEPTPVMKAVHPDAERIYRAMLAARPEPTR